MGLDMYLARKHYVKHYDFKGDDNFIVSVTDSQSNPIVDGKDVSFIIEEVGYWRKANAIHKWFVDNVQNGEDDCGSYAIEELKLRELLDLCYSVKEDPSIAQDVLPPHAGFFFGSTDDEEYYLSYIQETIDLLERVLSYDKPHAYSYEYSSSW